MKLLLLCSLEDQLEMELVYMTALLTSFSQRYAQYFLVVFAEIRVAICNSRMLLAVIDSIWLIVSCTLDRRGGISE